MVPVWLGIGLVLKRLDLDPFSKEEIDMLAEASAPVAQKWAGIFLPYAAELTLGGCILAVMWPKVQKKVDKEREEAAAKAAPKAPPSPPAPPPPVVPRSVAPSKPLPETRLVVLPGGGS